MRKEGAMKVGITFAMEKEMKAFFAENEAACLPVMTSGIGKVNAGIGAYRLIKEFGCTDIISFGCAGGLSPDVEIGDVIVGDRYVYNDVWCGVPNERDQVQGLPLFFPSNYRRWNFLKDYRHGLISTGDFFIEDSSVATIILQDLYPECNPLAVDMESAAIGQVCFSLGAGFTSVRVISDNPLTGKCAYRDFWEKERKEVFKELKLKFLKELFDNEKD